VIFKGIHLLQGRSSRLKLLVPWARNILIQGDPRLWGFGVSMCNECPASLKDAYVLLIYRTIKKQVHPVSGRRSRKLRYRWSHELCSLLHLVSNFLFKWGSEWQYRVCEWAWFDLLGERLSCVSPGIAGICRSIVGTPSLNFAWQHRRRSWDTTERLPFSSYSVESTRWDYCDISGLLDLLVLIMGVCSAYALPQGVIYWQSEASLMQALLDPELVIRYCTKLYRRKDCQFFEVRRLFSLRPRSHNATST